MGGRIPPYNLSTACNPDVQTQCTQDSHQRVG